MTTKNKKKSTLSAVQRINGLSKARFKAVAKKSTSSSEVLRNLGIYENGRNVAAVASRLRSEKVFLQG